MKCPHCNQEHSENALFCEKTGKKIEKSLKACTNSNCPDFGKYFLPFEATFCPRCGEKIGVNHSYSLSHSLRSNELSDNSGIYDRLFPIYGVSLGKTVVDEVEQSKLEEVEEYFFYSPTLGIDFIAELGSFYSVSGSFFSVTVNNGVMPPKWQEEFAFSYDDSFDDLITILRKEQFFFEEITVNYHERLERPEGKVIVRDISGKLKLEFCYINDRLDKISAEYCKFEEPIKQCESEEVYLNYIYNYAGKKIVRATFEMKITDRYQNIGRPDIAVGYISSGSIAIGDLVDVLDMNGTILRTDVVVGTFLVDDPSELRRKHPDGYVIPRYDMALALDKLDCSSGCVGISVRGVGQEYGNLMIGGIIHREWE